MSAVEEGWTLQEWRLTDDYLRNSMNEDVSIYTHRRPDRKGRWPVDYYFYGPGHSGRASDFLTRNPGGMIYQTRATATVVRLFHTKNPMSYPLKGMV